MALRVPDYDTFMATDEPNKRIWYRFLQTMIDNMPQQGNANPEGVIRANYSCLYTQDVSGTSVLWFNTVGNGSNTGWVTK